MTILLPIDRRTDHDRLIRTGVELTDALAERLHVVHLVGAGVPETEVQAFKADLEAELDEYPELDYRLSLEHVPTRGQRAGVRIGNAILELAEDVEYSHIVMGHRATGRVTEAVTKSAAKRVIDRADIPVTVVRDREEDPPAG